MASMREIKLRIKSIKETRQITKAMKLISAAKLKKARHQLEQTLPFFKKVKETMLDILTHSANISSIYFDLRNEKSVKKKAYLVLSGDKSLAGGYNHNLNKFAESIIKDKTDSVLFVAGMLGRNYFSRQGYNMFEGFDYPVQNPNTIRAREVAELLLGLYIKGEVDEINVIFTFMESSVKLEPRAIQLLPLDIDELKNDIGSQMAGSLKLDENIIYEPSPSDVLDILIPKYLKGIVYGTFVEAFTSEQSARMTAMDSATTNADEMLNKLNLFYNRARQAAITQEISEIVGGAEALK